MARLSRSWRTFRALTWAQRRLLAQAWLLLPLVALSLRLLGFRRTRAALLPPAAAVPCGEDLNAAQVVTRIAHSAARRSPVHASCLARSLVVCRLLSRQGLVAELRIGVAKPDARLEAHAWVEHGGVVLSDGQDEDSRFAAFDGAVFSRRTSAL